VENSFNTDWIPVVKEKFRDFVYLERLVPRNPSEFFEDPSSIVLFKMYQDNRSGSIKRMEKGLEDISRLRSLIKK